MRIACIGGGPGGLYAALLLAKDHPEAEITVHERNRPDDTFGWGVVFSDETLGAFEEADAESYAAIREAFGNQNPHISSTKSLTGHSQGATGAHEAIYSMLMMEHDFIAASANIEELDPDAGDANIVRERIDNAGLNVVMSNSFGFGGTNATLAFQRHAS